MEAEIALILSRFTELCENWQNAPGRMEKFAPYAYIWHPAKPLAKLTKPIGVTLQAITHGDEVGGIEALLQLLLLLKNGLLQAPFAIALVLGNPGAALKNCRFLERDLNRSFAKSGALIGDEQRARILEPLLQQSTFFIDFHQTIEPTLQPFFIFPYTAASMTLALALHSQLPIVTHWGRSFSKDGLCSDEYVNANGGTGLTLELGQKGFDPYHAALGLQVALAAIQHTLQESKQAPAHGRLYTWRTIVAFEAGMQLKEGLFNFQEVKAGDLLGWHNGQDLRAEADAFILFPKYVRDDAVAKPKELYRLVKRIQVDELGQEGVIGR